MRLDDVIDGSGNDDADRRLPEVGSVARRDSAGSGVEPDFTLYCLLQGQFESSRHIHYLTRNG